MEPQLEALSERDDARIIPPPPNNCPRCQERVQNCILVSSPPSKRKAVPTRLTHTVGEPEILLRDDLPHQH